MYYIDVALLYSLTNVIFFYSAKPVNYVIDKLNANCHEHQSKMFYYVS